MNETRVDLRLLDAIDQNMREIQAGFEEHCCLLDRCLGHNRQEGADSGPHGALCAFRGRERRLRKAIQEAIEVLEATRRSFKSKQLEQLRKRLTAVLIDEHCPDVPEGPSGSGPEAAHQRPGCPRSPHPVRRKNHEKGT